VSPKVTPSASKIPANHRAEEKNKNQGSEQSYQTVMIPSSGTHQLRLVPKTKLQNGNQFYPGASNGLLNIAPRGVQMDNNKVQKFVIINKVQNGMGLVNTQVNLCKFQSNFPQFIC
jgi:hypothetical protein